MANDRRLFLTRSGQALLALGAFGALPKDLQARIRLSNRALVQDEGFSVLQGFTTETTTQLTVDVPRDLKLRYLLLDRSDGRILDPYPVARVGRSFSSWAVDRISFSGLRLGRVYEFQIIDEKNQVLDRRELHALDRQKSRARVSILSCALDFAPNKEKRWQSVFRAQPDMVFFMGDNVYGDIGVLDANPESLWRRYVETRRRVPFYRARRLIPVLAVWDDHDYGKNNSNYQYAEKNASLDVFETFFAQDRGLSRSAGVSFTTELFGHQMVFLDNRFERDRPVAGRRTFLGGEQSDWLYKIMQSARRPLMLIQGCQVFGGYSNKRQSFEGRDYPEDFEVFRKAAQGLRQPMLLASGDVHITEIMKIEKSMFGFETRELTASSMHSFPKLEIEKNPRRTHLESQHNHLVVDMSVTASGPQYVVTCLGPESAIRFTDRFGI
jgi:alkaline phosphatase D